MDSAPSGHSSRLQSPLSSEWVNPTPVAVRDEFKFLMNLLIKEFKVIRPVHTYSDRHCDTMYEAAGSGINAVTYHGCSAQEKPIYCKPQLFMKFLAYYKYIT